MVEAKIDALTRAALPNDPFDRQRRIQGWDQTKVES